MKEFFSFLAVLLLFCLPEVPGQEMPGTKELNYPVPVITQGQQGKALVTYIANEGFLVQTGNHKILVDALFGGIEGNWCEQPGDSLLNLIIDGQPPFGNIDVILVSHYHADHFNAKMVSEFMAKNTRTILFCPNQVNQQLMKNSSYSLFSERIRSIHFINHRDTSIVMGDILVKAMIMNHGAYWEKDTITGELKDRHKDVENITYLVNTDGCTFSHSGDASIMAFENYMKTIPGLKKVDFAFMDQAFMQPRGMNAINELIKCEKLIFMHFEPARVDYFRNAIKDFPDIFIFSKPLESAAFYSCDV